MTKIQQLVRNCVEITGNQQLLAHTLDVAERTIFRWLSGESEPMACHVVNMYEIIIKHGHKLNR